MGRSVVVVERVSLCVKLLWCMRGDERLGFTFLAPKATQPFAELVNIRVSHLSVGDKAQPVVAVRPCLGVAL